MGVVFATPFSSRLGVSRAVFAGRAECGWDLRDSGVVSVWEGVAGAFEVCRETAWEHAGSCEGVIISEN